MLAVCLHSVKPTTPNNINGEGGVEQKKGKEKCGRGEKKLAEMWTRVKERRGKEKTVKARARRDGKTQNYLMIF